MHSGPVRFAWREPGCWRRFRTGVSLHSHTWHSRESIPIGDLAWTPPLSPREALELESWQIRTLGLEPLVSLTDHDDIEAGLRLRVLSESRHTPISVEWTLPWQGTVFHLGLHQLPARRAHAVMSELRRITARTHAAEVEGMLDWLDGGEETLIILNHPYWVEHGCRRAHHEEVLPGFLRRFRPFLHALELNGFRPWRENERVCELSALWRLPLISGGDRHGLEANANLNLTHARTFAEFVDEVRQDGRSTVLFMPQYRRNRIRRIARTVAEVVASTLNRTKPVLEPAPSLPIGGDSVTS